MSNSLMDSAKPVHDVVVMITELVEVLRLQHDRICVVTCNLPPQEIVKGELAALFVLETDRVAYQSIFRSDSPVDTDELFLKVMERGFKFDELQWAQLVMFIWQYIVAHPRDLSPLSQLFFLPQMGGTNFRLAIFSRTSDPAVEHPVVHHRSHVLSSVSDEETARTFNFLHDEEIANKLLQIRAWWRVSGNKRRQTGAFRGGAAYKGFRFSNNELADHVRSHANADLKKISHPTILKLIEGSVDDVRHMRIASLTLRLLILTLYEYMKEKNSRRGEE